METHTYNHHYHHHHHHHHASSASISPLPTSPRTEAADEDSIARLLDAVPQLDSLFNVSRCIGHGTFSSVYLARIKHTTTINGRRHFAIKHIIPTSHPSRVCTELRCLKMIGGQDNVMGITMCFRQMNHVVLVMPHFPHNPFSEYVGCMGTQELRDYLINLLCALRRVHSFRIIHRDVKPANFLYNRHYRRYSLVDFGLAQEMSQGGSKSVAASVSHSGGGGAGLKCSPPITDTPLTTSSAKTVKRKLSVYSVDEGEECVEDHQDGKRQCVDSYSSPKVAGILSSTTSRLNTGLRRSPRKKSVSNTSPRKENFETPDQHFPLTPKKEATHLHTQESPVKPAVPGGGGGGSVEGCVRMDQVVVGVAASQRSLTGALQLRLDVNNGLRRSPRKLASSASRRAAAAAAAAAVAAAAAGSPPLEGVCGRTAAATPLEGLAKHLHDASTMHRRGESSGVGGGLALASPKVSGLSFTPDLNGAGTKAAKNNRILMEVQSGSGSVLRPVSCHCYGSAKVCSVCLYRSNQVAPRAGTPGFRAPEVLLRHPNQDTGVDMWSVGVVLLSLLSGRYPFFRAADDLSNLAEITTLLGTPAVRRAAAKMGKLIKCSEERQALDLRRVCEFLHNNKATVPPGDHHHHHQCQGCRQRGVCVCLAPTPTDLSRAPPQKKRTHPHPHPHKALIHQDTSSLSTTLGNITLTPAGVKNSTTMAHYSPHTTTTTTTTATRNIEADITWYSSPPSSSSSSSSSLMSSSALSSSPGQTYPPEVYHLLLRLLDPSPDTRITAAEALTHPFLNP